MINLLFKRVFSLCDLFDKGDITKCDISMITEKQRNSLSQLPGPKGLPILGNLLQIDHNSAGGRGYHRTYTILAVIFDNRTPGGAT